VQHAAAACWQSKGIQTPPTSNLNGGRFFHVFFLPDLGVAFPHTVATTHVAAALARLSSEWLDVSNMERDFDPPKTTNQT